MVKDRDKLKYSNHKNKCEEYLNQSYFDDVREDYARDKKDIKLTELPIKPSNRTTDSSNVISMPQGHNGYPEIMMLKAGSLWEIPQAVQALGKNKSAILNLNSLNPDLEQIALNFIAGGICAINGHIQQIGERVFLLTPESVRVSNKSGVVREANSSKARTDEIYSWEKIFSRLA